MSFFTSSDEAERYAQSRPFFHPLAITRAMKKFGVESPILGALDVACGTGQSSTALASIAGQVIGCDISWHMIANAERHKRVGYVQARAEALPIRSGALPLISCALAFHWFDRELFLRETHRVLDDGGMLFIYTNGFSGIMREDPSFTDFSQVMYAERFPTPPRDVQPVTPQEAESAGFTYIGDERYENDVHFTAAELVAYLTTQTNVAIAIQEGRESIESASQWLADQIGPYFDAETATFVFVSRAWYLRKEA